MKGAVISGMPLHQVPDNWSWTVSIFALLCSEGFLNVLNSSYRVSSLKKTDQNIKLQHNKKLQKGTFLKQPILLAYSKAIHFIE